jgi:DNA-binding GntR family transcriptional regulator
VAAAERGMTDDLARLFRHGELQRAEPVARQAYRKLRQAIISRRLPTGQRLREVEIARALGVSRTPVHEAVARLVSDRLLRLLPGGGVEVVDTSKELEEIYHVRKALEGYAARLAAERVTDDDLRGLAAIVAESERLSLDAFEARVALNGQFHHSVCAASHVPRLIEMIHEFREYSTNPQTLRLYDRENAQKALQEHREILRWLEARDGPRTEQAMRDHLANAYRNMVSDRERADGSGVSPNR